MSPQCTIPKRIQDLDPSAVDVFREIVQVPAAFDTKKEEEDCYQMVDGLEEDELEIIARTSYAYWVLQLRNDPMITSTITRKIAAKVARWFLQNYSGNVSKALPKLKEAAMQRREQQIEKFRTSFEEDADSDIELEIRHDLMLDNSKQMVATRGQDREGRCIIIIKTPRTEAGTTERAYGRAQLYAADRAAAITEFMSRGKGEKCTALFSMYGQNSSVSPPLKWQIEAVSALQALYPGRVELLIISEAPFFIRTLFGALKPFLSESLRKNTQLVAGKAKREELLDSLIAEGGTMFGDDGTLTSEIDIMKYLNEVPFYLPYDYKG